MKVWKLNLDGQNGYYDNDPETFRYELEEELSCNPDGCGYTKEEIDVFMETVKNLEPEKCAMLGLIEISCEEMDDKKFCSLPEFSGW